jgi:hypothetical protein
MNRYLEKVDLSGLKSQGAVVAISALFAAILVLGVLKLSGNAQGGAAITNVAVFDVVKFANAQRAIASTFIGKREDNFEAGTLLMSLSKKTTAAIERIAGPGTIVLVKQGVVAGNQVDITDAVLTDLGLPTNVPTIEPMKYLMEVAPTMLLEPRRAAQDKSAPEAVNESPSSKVLP